MPPADNDDWRLQGQERYLSDMTFAHRTYQAPRPEWDHDHCEFCFAKFMDADGPDVLRAGFVSMDNQHWICDSCFQEFRDRFNWTTHDATP